MRSETNDRYDKDKGCVEKPWLVPFVEEMKYVLQMARWASIVYTATSNKGQLAEKLKIKVRPLLL
jgi:hypothetical protein